MSSGVLCLSEPQQSTPDTKMWVLSLAVTVAANTESCRRTINYKLEKVNPGAIKTPAFALIKVNEIELTKTMLLIAIA